MKTTLKRITLLVLFLQSVTLLSAQLPDNFEFLDHRNRFPYLGASTVMGDKLYYVGHNSLDPLTTFNVVDSNNNVETILSVNLNYTDSKLFQTSDTSAIVIIDNLLHGDFSAPGLYLINLSPNLVKVDTLLRDRDDIKVYNSNLDSLGRVVFSNSDELVTIQGNNIIKRDSTFVPYKIFFNNDFKLFAFGDRCVYGFDGSDFKIIYEFKKASFIDDVITTKTANYVLKFDVDLWKRTMEVFNNDFTKKTKTIDLPLGVYSFDQFIFHNDEIQVLSHDHTEDQFEIISIDTFGLSSSLHLGDAKDEELYKFIPLSKERYLLCGKYGRFRLGSSLFFRNYSLVEENIYERVNVEVIEMEIVRLGSDTIKTILDFPEFGDLYFGNHEFDIHLKVQNNGEEDLSYTSILSKSFLDGVSSTFHFDFEVTDTIRSGKSVELSYRSEMYLQSKGLRGINNVPLFIPGADFKFNINPFSELQVTVDVEDLILNDHFNVYPNPTTDVLNIELDNKIHSISIYDLSGRLMYHRLGRFEARNIDVSNLISGTYFLKLEIESKKDYLLSKFVKI